MNEPTTRNHHKHTYDVYVGRGSGPRGYFGNPYKVGELCPRCNQFHKEGRNTLKCFEDYARTRASSDPTYKAEVIGLLGKSLGCFCTPNPCHADVLARLAREWSTEAIRAGRKNTWALTREPNGGGETYYTEDHFHFDCSTVEEARILYKKMLKVCIFETGDLNRITTYSIN